MAQRAQRSRHVHCTLCGRARYAAAALHAMHGVRSAHGMCSSRHSTAASSTAEAAVVMASRPSQGRPRPFRRPSMALPGGGPQGRNGLG